MVAPTRTRELQALCVAVRAALLERVALTRFSLQMTLDGESETTVLVEPEPVVGPDECGRMPVRKVAPRLAISIAIRDEEGALGLLTVEHASPQLEAGAVRSEVERVARAYAPALRSYVDGRPG